jgi:hemerythrin-like domain-containing protein
MRPTRILEQEHEVILAALGVLRAMADRVAAGTAVPEADARRVVAFCREFADGSHHAKEEGVLFPEMERAGFPRHAGPLAVMLGEHEQGRELVAAIDAAIGELSSSEAARARFVEMARAYAAHLGQHIHKENQILFRMADQVLSPDEDGRVLAAFEATEAKLEKGLLARHRAAVEELSRTYP